MDWSWFLAPVERLPEPAELDGWFAQVQARCTGCDTLTSAMRGGRLAATPGLAFLAGYQAALRRLWPSAPPGLGALCATEQRSLRPADMQTRFTEGGISGAKDYVTAGPAAGWLLVAARDEAPGHSPRLSLYLVEAGAAGVTLEPGAPLPLVPDIPHARLRLDHAPARALEGTAGMTSSNPFARSRIFMCSLRSSAGSMGSPWSVDGRRSCSCGCWDCCPPRRRWPRCRPRHRRRIFCWPGFRRSSRRCNRAWTPR